MITILCYSFILPTYSMHGDLELGGLPQERHHHLRNAGLIALISAVIGAGSQHIHRLFHTSAGIPEQADIPQKKGKHYIALGASNDHWVSVQDQNNLISNSDSIKLPETFYLYCNDDNCSRVSIQSASNNHWIVAEGGGSDKVRVNRTQPKEWETFVLERDPHGKVAFKTNDGIHYLTTNPITGLIAANKTKAGLTEQFVIKLLD